MSAALTVAAVPAHALQAGVPAAPLPDPAAATVAGPVSTAAYGAHCIGAAHDDTAAFQAAIDTGHTVYAPALGGRCHLTAPLVMKTPGQIFGGDGRARTKIVIEPRFSGQGVFVAKTGEPGPVWRDFSVSFVQPDVDDRAKLTRYPPAFYAQSTPRFEMDHMGCYVATTCIDMKGNSGGATIADLQMSAFEVGIDIDGSLDTVRVTDPHWWPFELTQKQQHLFSQLKPTHAVAVNAGRVDGLLVTGGFFLGGEALHVFKSGKGIAFGTITNTSFDSCNGVHLEAGNFRMSALDFATNNREAVGMTIGDANATLSASHFFVGTKLESAMILQSGGYLSISGSLFESGSNDVTFIQKDNPGFLSILGNQFVRSPNITYEMPSILIRQGRVIAEANYASDHGKGYGSFVVIKMPDAFNRLTGNSTPGWN